jgi:hypothetical protein
MKQRLTPHQSEFLDVHGLRKDPNIALIILKRSEFLGHQRRGMVALVAAEVTMLGQIIFDAEQPDLLAHADGRIHRGFLGSLPTSALSP